MDLNVTIDFNQLKALITQCKIEEKIEIVQMLEKDTFPVRFNRILDKMRGSNIKYGEITKEVESVRRNRYGAGKEAVMGKGRRTIDRW